MSFLMSNFIDLNVLPVLLMSLAHDFLYALLEPPFSIIDPCHCFHAFFSVLLSMIFFSPKLTLGFACFFSFSNCFSCKVRLII